MSARGSIAGALVGLGANALEVSVNTQLAYADGREPMYGTILALRAGVFGFGLHATTAAFLGAAVGFVRGRRRGLDRRADPVVLGALVVAAAGHVAWNLVGSDVSQAVVRAITPSIDFNQNGPLPQVPDLLASTVASLVVMAPTRSDPRRGLAQSTGSRRSSGTDAIRAASTSLMSMASTVVPPRPPPGRRDIMTMQNGQAGGDRLGPGLQDLTRSAPR